MGGCNSPLIQKMENVMKKITQELLARGFINNNINTPSKESMFVYLFNRAVEVANEKKKLKKKGK